MTERFDLPKEDPADVVRLALDGVAAGALEVLADGGSVQLKAALSGDLRARCPQAA